MPILPERKKLYPKDWQEIRRQIRERSGNRCEGSPRFPNCRAEHGMPHPVTGSKVVLTCAHMDHDPRHGDLSRIRHLCQRCHLDHDRHIHERNRRQKVFAAVREGESLTLPLEEP